MIENKRITQTFCELATIDSPSGEEKQIASVLAKKLDRLGLTVSYDNYGNVIATDKGSNPLILSSHMDTVEPGRGVTPIVFKDRIESDGTTILGGDCKAGISAILEALESINESNNPRRSVEVILTREEEPGLNGARNLDFSMINGREALIFDGEGAASRITSASPTYTGFVIDIKGQAAHAGMEPEKGISAIRVAAELVLELPQGRLDSETTFNIGLIEGGQVRNAVPETTRIIGEFRSIEKETHHSVLDKFETTLESVRAKHPEVSIKHSISTEFEAYRLEDKEPFLKTVKTAIKSLGWEPTMETSGGGTDGNVFRQHNISAVVVGMAVTGMHTKKEWVSIPGLADAAKLCEAILLI